MDNLGVNLILMAELHSYQITEGVLAVSIRGNCEMDEFIAVIDRLTKEAEGETKWPLILDVREHDNPPSSAEIKKLINFLALKCQGIGRKVALYVAGDLGYGLGRVAGAGSETMDIDFRPFLDFDEAKAWLLEAPEA